MSEKEKVFTGIVWGVLFVLIGRGVFGCGWTCALLMFLPGMWLTIRMLSNDGEGVVRHAAVLVLLPLFALNASAIASWVLASVVPSGRAMSPSGVAAAEAFAVFGLFALAHGLAALIAKAAGDFALPGRWFMPVARTVAVVSHFAVLIASVWLLRFVGGSLFRSHPAVAFLVAVLAVLVFVFIEMRFLARKLTVPERGGTSASSPRSVPSVRVVTDPGVRLGDVVGMDDAKEQIRLRLIEPVRNADRARKYGLKTGGGVLLYGPPGTGKTMLARGVAGELGLPFYMITSADVFGKFVGESERNVRKIFSDVRRNPLSVVFIDELETLFPKRTGDVHESTRKVISVLLQELDGLDKSKNPILLLGATNVPWMVDEAFLRPGRFDIKVFVGLPDAAARRTLLIAAFAKGTVPHDAGLTGYMAERTKNYSGADLNGVMDRLRQIAYASAAPRYTRELADQAIAAVVPSVTGALLDRIADWENESQSANARNAGGGGRVTVRPETKLKDVFGMEKAKAQIRYRVIDPLCQATLARSYGIEAGGGVLLYGPPGTGKTFLARAVAGELEIPFYTITAADVFGKYVGESEGNVRRIFREIRRNDFSVVFIDELEALFPKRTENVHESTRKVISVLLQELDGVDQLKNPMLLLGATNVPWLVDEAFLRPGRFDVKVFVGLPDGDARRAMFAAAFAKGSVPCETGLPEYAAERTEGFSGADIKGVAERIRQTAFCRRRRLYDAALVDEVLSETSPTANGEILSQIRNWEARTSIDA